MTREIAVASTYGELAERMQNMAVYLDTVYFSEPEQSLTRSVYSFGFQYAPGGIECTTKHLVHHEFSLTQALFPSPDKTTGQLAGYVEDELNWDPMRCGPIQSVLTGRTHLMPVRFVHWVVGSNGMCAGNTRNETLIHGISEILERYVLKTTYRSPFIPPDIPLDLLWGQNIHERINCLEIQSNLKVSIKDCSLGRGLPALGVLLATKDRKKWAFHLGADPSPVTTLERCLTELFQGALPAYHQTGPVSG